MKYEEPNMELILIYDYVRTTDASGGSLIDDPDKEIGDGGDVDDLL